MFGAIKDFHACIVPEIVARVLIAARGGELFFVFTLPGRDEEEEERGDQEDGVPSRLQHILKLATSRSNGLSQPSVGSPIMRVSAREGRVPNYPGYPFQLPYVDAEESWGKVRGSSHPTQANGYRSPPPISTQRRNSSTV